MRRLKPPAYKRYGSFKRALQHEFDRTCIYCRMPDTGHQDLHYTVEHYRPKGLPRFSHLLCDYGNLYYCCHTCNSLKSDDWPVDENAGPFVPNPCEHVMSDHLRFDRATGRVEPRSEWGRHAERLLRLNDDDLVRLRKDRLTTLGALEVQIKAIERDCLQLDQMLATGAIAGAEHGAAIAELRQDLAALTSARQTLAGTVALRSLPKGTQVVR